MKQIAILILLTTFSLSAFSQGNFCGHDSVELAIRQRDSVRYDAFNRNFRNSIQYFRKQNSGSYATVYNSLRTTIDVSELAGGIYTVYIPELRFYYKLLIIR